MRTPPLGSTLAVVASSTCLLVVALSRPANGGPLGHRAGAALPAATGDRAFVAGYVRPTRVPAPDDNATTPARVRLGKALFFDPRLSGSRSMSCASCHNPGLAWGDGQGQAIGNGMRQLGRRSPTILNLAWADALFWDGRAGTLEEQALGPIQAAGEMNLPLPEMQRRVSALRGYQQMFNAAYPGQGISPTTVAKAIASFERTVISGDAPFDRWVRGDERAMSAEAKRGFVLFNTKAQCAKCHAGWRFTDDSFHDIGVAGADTGRAAVLPDIEGVRFAFKTPTLRNVEERYPYMHNGSEQTLDDVIELYDRGGRVRRPSLSDEIRPLDLSATEKQALRAFLSTLTSEDAAIAVPRLPR